MRTKPHRLIMGAAGLLASVCLASADPALLGNNALAGQKLDDEALKAVLLGKKATLGESRVVIVIIKRSDAQDAFFKDHVGMTTDQFQTYWRRLYMSGGGSAPKVVDTEAEGIKLASEAPGAIVVGDSAKSEGLAVLSGK